MSLPADVAQLRTPEAIRTRCQRILQVGLADGLDHFRVVSERLAVAARKTAGVTRQQYPDLQVPIHGRLRHFRVGGVDYGRALAETIRGLSPRDRAKRLIDVVVTSVLLDAGSGPDWSFAVPGAGTTLARSEGLAVASLLWLQTGALSGRGEPFAVDAEGLRGVSEAALRHAFQVSAGNPLAGVEGRLSLLQALGAALSARTDLFGPESRPAGMLDRLAPVGTTSVPAAQLLGLLLDGLGSIWPGRARLHGHPLGDVWRHPHAGGEGDTAGVVPFHKLSQWLTYSLVEPLSAAGVTTAGLPALTGLAEYRNGGLFIDAGVLVPRDAGVLATPQAVGGELVVEWRALTVALLDRMLPLVQAELGLSTHPERLPLSAMLEGGSWAAGRALAAEQRAGGGPPIAILSDGTVF